MQPIRRPGFLSQGQYVTMTPAETTDCGIWQKRRGGGVENPQVAGWRTRASAIGLAVLTLGLLIVRFIETLSQPATDVATLYAAARAISDNRTASIYDPAVLAQLNAAHQYASGSIFPFSYPPFTLLIFRPLTLFSFDTARVIWICVLFVALLGASLLLIATWVRVLPTDFGRTHGSLRQLVEASSLPMGGGMFPTLPFALTLGLLLLTLPLLDGSYWGASTAVVIFFLSLALYANAHRLAWLTGVALGLVAGFALWAPLGGIPALACLAALAFVLRPPWTALISTVVALAAVFLLPLLVVPLTVYGQFASENAFFSEVYATSLHNVSLSGFVSNLLVATEHTGTSTLSNGLKLAYILGIALLVVSVVLAIMLGILGEQRSKLDSPSSSSRRAWPLLATLLAVPALIPPVVWPSEAVATPLAAGLVVVYSLTSDRRTVRTWLSLSVAGIGLLLCIGAELSGIDGEYPPQATPTMLLTLLRPLAAILVWGAATAIVASATLRAMRRPVSEPDEARLLSALAANQG